MKDVEDWRPSKFKLNGRSHWSANPECVRFGSRLVTDLLAITYASAIDQHAAGRLVDLGCGQVPLYGMYRDRASEVVCVDWPSSLHNSLHVDVFADLNLPLPFDENEFDTVIATDVLEHLHTPEALFRTSARILRPGGKLIIGVPFMYWIHEAPHDFHRFTRFALDKMVRDSDLSMISLKSYGGGPEVIADITSKLIGSRPWVARPVISTMQLMMSLPFVQKLSSRTKEHFPLGYILIAQKPQVAA